MAESTVSLPTPDGAMNAFLVTPAGGGKMPGIVVAQEAFGVNGHIREICRRLAASGYAALAPELYHREGPGLEFAYSDYEACRPRLAALTNDGIEVDVNAAMGCLRSLPQVDPARVGVIGFCMGGFVAFLAACRTDVAAAVSFYGGGIVRPRPAARMTPILGEADRISCPILCLFGAEDASIPAEDVQQIRERLRSLSKRNEVVTYPNAGHGFLCEERSSYSPVAAEDAWKKTLAWFAELLGRQRTAT